MAKTASKAKAKKRTPKAKKVIVEQKVIAATDDLGNAFPNRGSGYTPLREMEAKYDNDSFWDAMPTDTDQSANIHKFDCSDRGSPTVADDQDPFATPTFTKPMKWVVALLVVALIIGVALVVL